MFPLAPNAKAPAVRDWEHRASTDPADIDRWPRATTGYGVACGPSGLYVVDCDQPKPDTPAAPESAADAACGHDVLLLLAAEAGEPMAGATFTVRTGRGGMHFYYQAPDVRLGNTAGKIGWLIDTRGHGGYVVGAGSTVAGSTYRTILAAPPAPMPAWLVTLLSAGFSGSGQPADQAGNRVAPSAPVRLAGSPVGPEWATAALQGEADRIRTAPTGQGNHTVNAAAYAIGRLVGARLLAREDAVRELVAALDTWAWSAPTDRARMLRTLDRGMTSGEQSPRAIAPTQQRRRAA